VSLLALLLGGFGLTTVLVIAPMVIGGLHFTTFRGNAIDTFNYITGAGYLDHEAYTWALQTDTQALIDRHPSYYIARDLLSTRFTTYIMLAYTSRVALLPIYRFEHGFSLIFFIIAFGPAFFLGLLLRIKQFHAFLLAIAICAGFWAQFVLDIRAMSHMNSISAILVLALISARIEEKPQYSVIGEYVLWSIAMIAIIFSYIEIVPLLALGLAIFVLTRFVLQGLFTIRQAAGYLFTLCLTAMGILSVSSLLGSFLRNQIHYAVNGHNDWHKAFFKWLYADPIIGLWGLSYLSVDERIAKLISPVLLRGGMLLLGFLLLFVLNETSPQQAAGYQEENLILMRNHGFSNSSL
jgi:hypothetical protein